MTSATSSSPQITTIRDPDFDQWAPLFKAYVDFYKSSLPEEQYRKTFARLVDPKTDLYGIVLRDAKDESKLLGIAHYFPHQTPWNEKPIMHLNDLFIDPSLRGQGFGRKMIQEVAERAKADGCLRLQWATQHGNPARKLYDELAVCDFVEYRLKW